MNRIKTSENNRSVVRILTQNKFQFKDDRTIAQIALAYSIQLNEKFEESDYDKYDNKGKEYPESLLGEINRVSNDSIYKAILNYHYSKNLSEYEFTKLVKLHIDHGLSLLSKNLIETNRGKNAHIDYLVSLINNGLRVLTPIVASTGNTTRNKVDISAYNKIIKVNLGICVKSGEPIVLNINDENEFDSQHFAFAGMNGSGKTQLVQDILYQISSQTNNELKFIFFDYKGEGKSDKLRKFINATKCEFIDIQSEPFRFNPLSSISMTNERDRRLQITAFRDKLGSVDKRLGTVQKNSLYIAIERCFNESLKSGIYPTMKDVYEKLLELYEDEKRKHDSLITIMHDISQLVFGESYDTTFNFFNKSLYVNLPGSLPDAARKASVFLVLNHLFNLFIDSTDVKPSENRVKPIRYIIVIDEAHAFLKEKNMASVLEDLLRMIRSKGVIVMMLSQGIEEYKQREFDFSSQIKIPVLLNVQNKDIKHVKSFVGSTRSDRPLEDALKKLEGGKAIINLDEPRLCKVNMFWKRNV